MTLGGLALGAGMLVDNAIVVIENIFRRRQLGEAADEAAVKGASEVGVAIVASTLTTPTVIVGLAIPISVLATFSLMYFQNITLNIMTLGGLALGAGMLVDNAIVVIENIFRRRQLGEAADEAAMKGASEVGVAIVASTLTTIIVFLPIVFVRGVAAELFKEQAWVVAFSQESIQN